MYPASPAPRHWINRSTLGLALASLLSDISHELATAVLPAFLIALGGGPLALGLIEGLSDGGSALAKLWGGWQADRLQRRKPLASIGYLITAVGVAAVGWCTSLWQVGLCRLAAWLGKGSRSASRDLLLSEAAAPADLGKAYGLERAGDSLGAVAGPLLALWLLSLGWSAKGMLKLSLIPGLMAFLALMLLVRETAGVVSHKGLPLRGAWKAAGAPFRKLIAGVALFGLGDFSRTLLIMFVMRHLVILEGGPGVGFGFASAAGLAMGLYALHNAITALAAMPLGALADRVGRRKILAAGYTFAALVTLGFALLPATPFWLTILFCGSGLYIACQEVAEKSGAVELLPREGRGLGLGLLAAVNGLADTASSALIGLLWMLQPDRPAFGFFTAAALQAAGALLVFRQRKS